MKRTIIITTIVALLMAAYIRCLGKKGEGQPVEYEFPEAMPAHIREMNRESAEKGLIVYRLTCARCHSETVKKREVIPDFTLEQLETYQIRMANAMHEAELKETALTPEELSLVTTFFTYKKKNRK